MRQLVSGARQMQAVAIGWQIYDLARLTRSIEESAFILGLVGLAQFLPVLPLSLVGAWIKIFPKLASVDRLDRLPEVIAARPDRVAHAGDSSSRRSKRDFPSICPILRDALPTAADKAPQDEAVIVSTETTSA